MDLFTFFCLTSILLIVIYYLREWKYQKTKLPPCVPYALPFLGHSIQMYLDPVQFFITQFKKFGGIFTIQSLRRYITVVSDKQYVSTIAKEKEAFISLEKVFEMFHFVEYEGIPLDSWEMKTVLTYLKKHSLFNASQTHQLLVRVLTNEIQRLGKSGSFEAFTLAKRIVTNTASNGFFGLSFDESFFEGVFEFERRITKAGSYGFVMPQFIASNILTPYVHSIRDKLVNEYLLPELNKQLNDDEELIENQFLKYMVIAAKKYEEEVAPSSADGSNKILGRKIDRVMLSRCIIAILFASLSNTANAIAQTLCCVLENPNVLKRAQEEVSVEKKWDSEDWVNERSSFLQNCAWETSRYAVHRLGSIRAVANKDFKLGDSGYTLPEGTLVLIPSSVLSFDDQVFQNPYEYDPTRFEEPRREFQKSNLVAWGQGIHACPGQKFALAEMKMVLGAMLHHFDLKIGHANGKFPELVNSSMTTMCPRSSDCYIKYELKSDRQL